MERSSEIKMCLEFFLKVEDSHFQISFPINQAFFLYKNKKSTFMLSLTFLFTGKTKKKEKQKKEDIKTIFPRWINRQL